VFYLHDNNLNGSEQALIVSKRIAPVPSHVIRYNLATVYNKMGKLSLARRVQHHPPRLTRPPSGSHGSCPHQPKLFGGACTSRRNYGGHCRLAWARRRGDPTAANGLEGVGVESKYFGSKYAITLISQRSSQDRRQALAVRRPASELMAQLYNATLALAPLKEHPILLNNIGVILGDLSKYHQAVHVRPQFARFDKKAFADAIKINPTFPLSYFNLAETFRMGFDANDLAVAASDEALRLDPLSAPGVANAIAYRQVRNPAAALANAAALLRLGGHPEFNGDAAASFKFVQGVPFSQRRVRRRPHRVCLPRSAFFFASLTPPPPKSYFLPLRPLREKGPPRRFCSIC
jgi:tetratricopeptide (TPR) repeat protein